MLSTDLKKNMFIFFFIFFNLISKQNITNSYSLNLFFFYKIKNFVRLNKYFKKNNSNAIDVFFKKKTLFDAFNVDYDFSVLKEVNFQKKFYLTKNNHPFSFKYFLSSFNLKFYNKLLNFFFLNSFLSYNSFFARAGFFNFFFFKNSKGAPYLINVNKVMARWSDFFNLMLNLYLNNLAPLLYSSPFFKVETLSLNWTLNLWDINSWKLTYPHFIFKTNYFSQKTGFFYKKLREWGYTLYIVSDCIYHYKNMYFFRKNGFYTIGLLSLNINPWLVTYPVIASSNSYLNQIFFLQALIYSQKKAFLLQFFFFKKLWNFSYFFLFLK